MRVPISETRNPLAPNFAFALTTFNRDRVLRKTLSQLRRSFPGQRIYVADQNGTRRNSDLYQQLDVLPIWLDEDAGLSKARNSIVRQADEKYLFFVDDDDLPSENCSPEFVEALCQVFATDDHLLAIGGSLVDRKPFHFDFEVSPDEPKTLIFNQAVRPVQLEISGKPETLIEADCVLNFGLFSRERMVQWGLCWNEELKIHEHTDFFLKVWQHKLATGQGRVLHFDQLQGKQVARTRSTTYSRSRYRSEFLNLANRNHGFDLHEYRRLGEASVFEWVNRDKGWRSALTKIGGILEEMEIPWGMSGNTLEEMSKSGNFGAFDREIQMLAQVGTQTLRKLEDSLVHSGLVISYSEGYPGRNLSWWVQEREPIHPSWQFDRTTIKVDFLPAAIGFLCEVPTRRLFNSDKRPPKNVPLEKNQDFEFVLSAGKKHDSDESNWPVHQLKEAENGPVNIEIGAGFVTALFNLRQAGYRFFLYRRSSDFVAFRRRHRAFSGLLTFAIKAGRVGARFGEHIGISPSTGLKKVRAAEKPENDTF